MSEPQNVIRWETRVGEPISAGDVTVRPASRAFTVRTPAGGLVWNRPVAVDVERNGVTEHYRIVDVTRVLQIVMLALSVLFTLLSMRGSIRLGREDHGY